MKHTFWTGFLTHIGVICPSSNRILSDPDPLGAATRAFIHSINQPINHSHSSFPFHWTHSNTSGPGVGTGDGAKGAASRVGLGTPWPRGPANFDYRRGFVVKHTFSNRDLDPHRRDLTVIEPHTLEDL